ncbi:MAG: hypothetical protein WB424_10130 [Terracidiphilus sp.]
MRPIKFFATWSTVFVVFSCLAQTINSNSGGRLELPSEHLTRLPSPSGRYALVGINKRIDLSQECAKCFSTSSKLWFEDNTSHARKLLLNVNSTAFAGWSPDGSAFYVEDHLGSNITEAYIFETATLKKVDIADRILAADSEAKHLNSGHAYFNSVRWQDNDNLLVRFNGHTDELPITCFDMEYLVSRSGMVKKLSGHTGPADAAWCHS